MRQFLGLFLGVIVGLAGCATPLPVVRLQPRGSNVIWMSGRALASRTSNGIRTAVAFDHQEGNTVVFRVEVQNDAEARFDVDPKEMRFTTCVTENTCSARMAIADPEQQLIALDTEHAQAEADRANKQTAGAALIMLGAAVDVAEMSKRHRNPHLSTEAVVTTEISDQHAAAAVDGIAAERDKWAATALRRTTLFPGQGVAGFVYVPVVPRARYLWLNVAIARQDFWFAFDQAVFMPGPVAQPTQQG